MILDAAREFNLPYPGSRESALRFLRDPARSLSHVRFLRDLQVQGDVLQASLLVSVPMLGETALPFQSRLTQTDRGANLEALPLPDRLWAELEGEGSVQEAAGTCSVHYALRLRAHLDLPQAEKWGGLAFEKMLRETARRTLERVTRDFPAGVAAAMEL